MPVWPKSIYSLGLSLRTAVTEWKLRQKRASPAAQRRVFAALIPRLAATSVWRQTGIETGMPYARFRERVPLQTHEQLTSAIERMKQGEVDVLWPGKCTLFATTSGATTGEPRHVPMTEQMLAHIRRAGLDAILYYTVRVRRAAVFRGRHLLFGGSTALTPVSGAKPGEAFAGDLSGIAALSLPAWAEKHLYEPGAHIARVADWDAKLDGVVAQTSHRDVSLIAGLPNWTLILANVLRERYSQGKRRAINLQSVWPNLECFVHSGMPIAPHYDEVRSVLGPGVKFHEVYAASEAVIAVQDGEPVEGLRVLPEAGAFFEFLPMSEFDEARLEHIGGRAVPLEGVKTEVDYAVLLTTAGGLARYVLGDVVRFTSSEPPRLVYVGRTKLRLDGAGERVMEKDLTDALVSLCQRRDWTIVNFHVAPMPIPGIIIGQYRSRHEWWVELKPGTITTPTGPQMAAELDAELNRLNDAYAMKRKNGALEPPIVRLVMPGVFEHWMRYQRTWGGQHKMPRCRPDRLIADQLGQITHFARD